MQRVKFHGSQHVMTGHAYDKKSDANNQGDEPAARMCIHDLALSF
ncbi:MAG: hypothetical protein WCF56_02570 [Pseudolabrys sp.]